MSADEQRWPLKVFDASGRECVRSVLLLERWRDELGRPSDNEDFRIVVLATPAEDVRPEGSIVVCPLETTAEASPLAEVLNESMVGQVRRVLAEARVRRALAPVLEALQQGRAPGQEEMDRALARVRQVLERSCRALGGGQR